MNILGEWSAKVIYKSCTQEVNCLKTLFVHSYLIGIYSQLKFYFQKETSHLDCTVNPFSICKEQKTKSSDKQKVCHL